MKKILNLILILTIVISGIFCYQGMQSMKSHCAGDVESSWCESFISHGTIISDAIVGTVISILIAVISISLITPFVSILKNIGFVFLYIKNIKDKIPILSPIQLAISDGVIHPRIP